MHISLRAARMAVIAVGISLAPATALAHPGSGIVVDKLGQIYFLDTGAGVWKIGVDGTLVKLGGPRYHWMAVDNTGRFSNTALPSGPGGKLERIADNASLIVSSDYPIGFGPSGSLYFSSRGPGPFRLLELRPGGSTTTLASLPARADNASVHDINGIAVGADGAVFYTENRSIRRVSRDGRVSSLVSNVVIPGCSPPPGEPPNNPLLRGLAVDSAGTVYVAASGCSSLVRIAGGKTQVILQLQSPWAPTAVALHHGNIYVLEYLHTAVEDRASWIPRVRRILPDGRSSIIATVHRQGSTSKEERVNFPSLLVQLDAAIAVRSRDASRAPVQYSSAYELCISGHTHPCISRLQLQLLHDLPK